MSVVTQTTEVSRLAEGNWWKSLGAPSPRTAMQ